MGITKEQLTNTVKKVKTYVDTEIKKIDTTSETTYSDEEVNQAIDGVLGTTSE